MVQLIVLLMLFLKSKSLFPKDSAGERKEILFVICSLIVQVSVVLRRTVVGSDDWCFDNLSGSHIDYTVSSLHVLNEINVMVILFNSQLSDGHKKLSLQLEFKEDNTLFIIQSLLTEVLFQMHTC